MCLLSPTCQWESSWTIFDLLCFFRLLPHFQRHIKQQQEGFEKIVNYHKCGKTGVRACVCVCLLAWEDTWDSVESEGTGLINVSCFRHCSAEKRARPKSIGPMMGKYIF